MISIYIWIMAAAIVLAACVAGWCFLEYIRWVGHIDDQME